MAGSSQMVPQGYTAARNGAVLLERPDRYFLRLEGRAPFAMMKGLVTGALPPEWVARDSGIVEGKAPYSLILTPKGRPLTDLRLIRLEPGTEAPLLLDLARAGETATRAHFKQYLPPRMARPLDPDPPFALVTVVGPRAAELVAQEVFEGGVPTSRLEGLEEGGEVTLNDGPQGGIRAIRNGDTDIPAFDLVASETVLPALLERLRDAGAEVGGAGLWDLLRIEHGRPRYGLEFDETALPPEVGLERRAIDHSKGCYTGQEVIVRIRDRGQVNRLLRGLLLGNHPLPPAGTPLFAEGRARSAGEIRSAVWSPRFEQGIALGFVRREVEPGGEVHLEKPDGPGVGVRALGGGGWAD